MHKFINNAFRAKIEWLPACVFFTAFFLFLRFLIRTELIYYYFEMSRRTPFFRTDLFFLYECLVFPGGLARYIASFLTQVCSFPAMGAAAVTLLALGIYLCTVALMAVPADSILRVFAFMPSLLVLMICGRYENSLTLSTAALAAAFFSVIFQKFSPNRGWLKGILFFILAGLLYWVAGSAVLILIITASMSEFFNRRKTLSGILYLVTGVIFCWLIGMYIFKLDESELYLSSLPFIPIKQIIETEKVSRIFGWLLFAVIPAAVFISYISRLINTNDLIKQRKAEIPMWGVQVILLFIIALPAALFSYDYKAKRTLQVGYFTSRRMWPQVLAVVRKGSLRKYYPFCNNAVSRALFYTGKLGDEMFAYPQSERDSDLVFCKIHRGNVVYIERAEVCLELGLVNVAEEIACEFLAGTDSSPYILKQLAWINIVKGQIETAEVYLRALTKSPAYRGEAVVLLRLLEKDPQSAGERRVQHIRQIMMRRDIPYIVYDEGVLLEELLKQNKGNKMAFEYLMAHYLLNKNLDKFIENLPRLDDFDYQEIPRHYQEAVLLYIGITRKDVNLGQRGIIADVKKQYDEINQLGQAMSNNIELLKKVLTEKYSDTYFFYFTFGFSEPLNYDKTF